MRKMPSSEAHDHGPEAALGVQPLEEHAEEEHHEDRRRQIALHGLQVVVEAVRALITGNPGQGDQHHDDGGDAARAHNLVLRWPGLPLLIEVHGEERRAGVEHAGQRAHQRREQPGHHDAAQPGRQQVLAPSAESAAWASPGSACRPARSSRPAPAPCRSWPAQSRSGPE